MPEARATRVRVARNQARDQLSHFVAPPSAGGRPCPHRCCRNYRVHPRNLPVRLDRKYLRSLSEDELVRELESYQRYSDTHEAGFLQIITEAGRRDDSADRATARKERARDQRARETAEYRDEVYRQWFRAENGIQGAVLLNKAGRGAGIDERSLFSGPQTRVDKYASDELKEWFDAHPRMTRQQFDASRINSEDREAARRYRERQASQRRQERAWARDQRPQRDEFEEGAA